MHETANALASARCCSDLQLACLLAFQGGLNKLAGAAATVDTLSKEAQQQRVQLRASQVPLTD